MVNRLPSRGDLRPIFGREFQGMVVEPVTAEELRIAGEQLVSRLHEEMTQGIEDFDNGRDWLTR
jgi:hypothetical protein